ncbi:MAG: hypothetical protein ACYTGZ_17580 [Planctomycetota bacterium]|jgi:hypothetical protein
MRCAFTAVLTLLCCAILAGCSRTTELPDEFLGRWENEDPRYEGRYLVITRDDVSFGSGKATAVVEPITDVELLDQGGARFYVISHRNPSGSVSRLTVQYLVSEGALRLRNKPRIIWSKVVEKNAPGGAGRGA